MPGVGGCSSAFLKQPNTNRHGFDIDTGALRVAGCSVQGWRSSMEDAHSIVLDVVGDGTLSAFAVCDGHGGPESSAEVGRVLPDLLRTCPHFQPLPAPAAGQPAVGRNIAEGMRWVISKAEAHLAAKHGEGQCTYTGTTLVLVIVTPENIYCANVGDSRAVLCRGSLPLWAVGGEQWLASQVAQLQERGAAAIAGGMPGAVGNSAGAAPPTPSSFEDGMSPATQPPIAPAMAIDLPSMAVPLSRDHKPTDLDEAARVIASGGAIRNGRVSGMLAMTRALGDFELKQSTRATDRQAVLALPEIVRVPRRVPPVPASVISVTEQSPLHSTPVAAAPLPATPKTVHGSNVAATGIVQLCATHPAFTALVSDVDARSIAACHGVVAASVYQQQHPTAAMPNVVSVSSLEADGPVMAAASGCSPSQLPNNNHNNLSIASSASRAAAGVATTLVGKSEPASSCQLSRTGPYAEALQDPSYLLGPSFIVMACDGIWDCLTSQDVVDYFIDENVADPDVDAALVCENLCQSIVSPTLQVIGSDNLTLMVIVLK